MNTLGEVEVEVEVGNGSSIGEEGENVGYKKNSITDHQLLITYSCGYDTSLVRLLLAISPRLRVVTILEPQWGHC